jgi:hypothetical protein
VAVPASDLLELLRSGMYSGVNDLFMAPVPHDVMARATRNSIFVLLFESLPQIAVVSILQQYILGDWTPLNIVLVSSSVLSTGGGVVYSCWYAEKETAKHRVAISLRDEPPQSTEMVIMANEDGSIDCDVPSQLLEQAQSSVPFTPRSLAHTKALAALGPPPAHLRARVRAWHSTLSSSTKSSVGHACSDSGPPPPYHVIVIIRINTLHTVRP